jgi:hypothetical protein
MAGVKRGCHGRKHEQLVQFNSLRKVSTTGFNMNATIIDFTEAQQEYVAKLLAQRYGKQVELQLADSELQLDLLSEKLTTCPTLYWSERGAQFVVYKIGDERYRCQFFYSATEQFGTGHDEYDDIEKCVVTLLQVQSDHERQLAKLSSAATTIASIVGDEYEGPLVI